MRDILQQLADAGMIQTEEITAEELDAAREWISAEKDRIPSPAKAGILKLLNNEINARILREKRPGPHE